MPIWLAFVLYLITAVGVLGAGLTLLVSPSSFRRITDRIGQLDRFSAPNPGWKPGLDLQWRIMGGILAGGALPMLWPVIRAAFFGVHRLPPPASTTPEQQPAGWYALGIGVAIIASGIFMMVRPESAARWAVSTLPHREFTPEQVRRGLLPIRIFGAVLVVAGLTAVALALVG
jgi:hypothetical protein